MFNAALKDEGHDKNKWCFACQETQEVYNGLLHSATNEQPYYSWHKLRTSIHDYRVWGSEVFCKNYGRK